ncbi:MAG: TetR/AcrR family transcriptional regulator C-terminal domain-containing protein [[Clostridium] scindens]
MIEKRTTKQILVDSVLDLLSKKPIQKISVQEIAAHCHVSTRSFYNHFLDKQDIVNWIYLDKEKELFRNFNKGTSLHDSFLKLFSFVYDNMNIFLNIQTYTGQNNLSENIIEQAKKTMTAAIKANENITELDEETQFAIEFWLNGVIAMTAKWLKSPAPLPPWLIFYIWWKSSHCLRG